jgi:inosine triphosphate pyrophosphatase
MIFVGWNPAFEYEGRTFAEMTKEEKSKISGRKRALDRLQAWLKESTKVED